LAVRYRKKIIVVKVKKEGGTFAIELVANWPKGKKKLLESGRKRLLLMGRKKRKHSRGGQRKRRK